MFTEDQKQALSVVCAKLSDLRSTLTSDQQIVLDLLVAGTTGEVAGHARGAFRAEGQEPKDIVHYEVEGHAAHAGAAFGVVGEAAEVAAHMVSSAQTAVSPAVAAQASQMAIASLAAQMHAAVSMNAAANGYIISI